MLCGTDFGSDKHSLLVIYKSLIRSKIDYGAQVYANASPNSLKILENIQNKALRIALRALPCTPACMLEEEAGILPLALRRRQQIINFWARVQSRKIGNPVSDLFGTGFFIKAKYDKGKHRAMPFGAYTQSIVEEAGLKDVSVADLRPSKVPPWTLQDPSVDIYISKKLTKSDLPHLVKAETLSYIDQNYAEHLKIYTDGSKNPETGIVACAFYIPSKNIKNIKRLSNHLSIFSAELLAIKDALDWVISNKPIHTAILSDSLSSLQSIQNRGSSSRPDLIKDILEQNDKCLEKNLMVTMVWVPAHVGLKGNEVVDGLAKEGLRRVEVNDPVPLAPTEVYSLARRHVINEWRSARTPKTYINTFDRTSVSLQPPNKLPTFCYTVTLTGDRGQNLGQA
ncbi:uncharacterized protein LOC128216002 [Mya arenaria]|uniref:uncharacterized protein LOC128216002 n=1 Tax=Mya arenaria TaxID=6604 RepID=UPI0022E783B4|nr:uncharacterized protein LOC128216002 [Mya arenaria]